MANLPRITRKNKIVESPTFPNLSPYPEGPSHSIEEYTQYLESRFNALSKSSSHTPIEAILKTLAAPPQEFSYARISSMPDMYNDGVIQWPDLSPQAFQKVVQTNLAPQMIIGQRVDDVLMYARPSTHPYIPGWKILPRDGSTRYGDATRKEIRDAERFLLQCNLETGWDARKRDSAGYQGWTTFLSSIVRDTLTFDAIAIFTDMDNKDRVKGFKAISAANISLTGKDGYKGNKEIFAVGTDEAGNVITEFTRDNLIWYVRNPRTNPTVAGYGLSEIFIAIKLIGGLTNALDLNLSVFDRNCFSEDTQVLTRDGWKYFNEVDQETDEFLTLNLETDEAEYQKATHVVWTDYEGEMYHLKSPSIDMIVTPEHRILYRYAMDCCLYPYQISTAEELYEKQYDNYIIPLNQECTEFSPFDMEKIHYKGKIGCVSVPNTIIYVRRNGKPCWSGNSVPNGMLLLKGMGWTQRQLDILARLWIDLKQGATKAWALPAMAVPEGAEVDMLDLSSFRNDMTIYYADFMNFATAVFCMIYRFPYQRLGYRSTGTGTGTTMPNASNPSPTDDVDIGKAPLLGHIETIVNEYLLWTRWPDLQFHFTGKNPKEDNREFEFRVTSMTLSEKRVACGLPPLEDIIDKKYKDLAVLMGMAPVDPSMAGIFQNAVSTILKNDNESSPEALYPSKKDPAVSAEHGHQSGVRRDSAQEEKQAEENRPEE